MLPRDFALLLVICLVWASNFVVAKLVLADLHIPPLFFSALRLGVVLVAVCPWLLPVPRPVWRMIAVGLLMGAGSFGLMTIAGYGTNGHLMVIRGFTQSGDVVVNDPASRLIPSNAAVENVFDRQQFANVWLPAARSGGIAYVIRPAGTPLPANTAGLPANW